MVTTIRNIDRDTVVVIWDKLENITQYTLQQSEDGMNFEDVDTFLQENDLYKVITNLNTQHTYAYRVKYINATGEESYSEVARVL